MFFLILAITFTGYQRQGTPNGHNGNSNHSQRDPISPVHNDSTDYKYGKSKITNK